ncbi:MAG TPA: radical SAM protein, partial [Aquificaceae bacterium]|nr:radical SAM protein [Aquificaceae bacterium]
MIRAIYVHIPFCSYRCPYCNFVSLTNSPISPEDYVDLVIKEAKLYGDMRVSPESLYFGGGTPTLLKPSLLGRLMEGLSGCFDFSNLREVTVERNPETYSLKELKALRDMGINRLSIGVQSFTEKGLRALGRKHTREDVIRAYEESVEAGFDNINLDLIYAYPGQSVEDVEEEIRWLGILKPRHVSAYMLTPHLPDEE